MITYNSNFLTINKIEDLNNIITIVIMAHPLDSWNGSVTLAGSNILENGDIRILLMTDQPQNYSITATVFYH